jgi:aspartate kinase
VRKERVMRVLKFGGSSLATAERIVQVTGIVSEAASREQIVVVVSALAGVTDILVDVADRAGRGDSCVREVELLRRRHLQCLRQLASNGRHGPASTALAHRLDELAGSVARAASSPACPYQVRDLILATGERLSVVLVAAALGSAGLRAEAIDATELVRTDSRFGNALVDHAITSAQIRQRLGALSSSTVPVMTGFIGSDAAGRTTTLGRGGSDYSASLVGASLAADRVEIWTDVDGVLTGPPRLLPDVTTLSRLTYEEAAELAFFGAKVLHRDTMRPLASLGIPILVRNTMAPDLPGTCISAAPLPASSGASAVTAVEDVAVFTATPFGPGSRSGVGLIRALAEADVEVLVIARASARGSLVVAIPGVHADRAARVLERESDVEKRGDLALIAAIGHNVGREPGFAAEVLTAIAAGEVPVTAAWAGSSDHSVTVLVMRRDLRAALELLHDRLVRGRCAGGIVPDAKTAGTTVPGSPELPPQRRVPLSCSDREAAR